ncbi:MAG: YihY/virulence factor BrkB family protein [Thermodesulfobacteriota bacterium]
MIRIGKYFIILREAFKNFHDNGCFDKAAAISFYAFFSLIPILFLTTVLLGYLMGTREGLLDEVIDMARRGLPYMGPRIISDLKGLATGWKTFGWLSIVLVILTAEFVLNAASEALKDVFEIERKHGFFKKKVIHAVILLIPVFAAFASISITALARILTSVEVVVLGFNISVYLQGLVVTYVLPFSLMTMAVAAVYRLLSGPNLNFDYAFYGSLVFTTLWELSKQFFAVYISYVPTYNRFYVSIGTMMILLLYIFFTASIFLFSATLARAAFRLKMDPFPWASGEQGARSEIGEKS